MTPAAEPIAPAHPLETEEPAPIEETPAKSNIERAIIRQCTAHSSRTGARCRQPAIRGGTVCRAHGGSAPQVRAAANERLEASALRAAGYVVGAFERTAGRKRVYDGIGLAAAREVLNRVLGVPGQTLTVQGDAGGPVRVVHVYAQAAGALALPAGEGQVIDAEGGESPVDGAESPARGEVIESPMKRRFAF